MITRKMTAEEIKTEGLEALVERLGPLGAIEFLQIFHKGSGNYTEERHQWLPNDDAEKILREIIEKQNKSK
jgi:hypothetical protein